jgi:general nucleoside transport system ATP-binding protein
MRDSPPLVALEGITKRFGTFVANDHVNLTVRPGEIHALLGENGAGKSTLVKILYGLLSPDAGSITLDGRPVTFASPTEARRAGIGMVFQHFSLFESMSVLENIALGMDGQRADAALRERVTKLAHEYGLSIEPGRPVWSLSAGERQRIEILRCLIQDPRLIVLDEPTSVLTPAESDALFETLRRLAGNGAGVLFISHKLDEVREHCGAATILRQGKMVATCDPRRETARSLARLMVGEAVAEVRATSHTAGETVLDMQYFSIAAPDQHGTALRAISLTVRAGEIVAIGGIAGNGQAELFAALSGEHQGKATANFRLLGQNAAGLDIDARRALGAAFVPEDRLGHAAVPNATLSANLLLSWHRLAGMARGPLLNWGAARRQLEGLRKAFDVRAAGRDPMARQLSGGNLQKFVMGREMMRKPRLLVINQPTWGIDAAAASALRQGLIDLATSGTAIVVISQDLDEILEIGDRIAVLASGRLSPLMNRRETTRAVLGELMTQAGAGQVPHAA